MLRALAPAWRPESSWLASRAPREVPRLDLSASSRASLMRPCLRKLRVVRPTRLGPSRGSWVCVGEDGPCWASFEPHRRPQAGKSGDPHSQNADSSPRAQGVLGLGLAAKSKESAEHRGIKERLPYRCNETKTSRAAGRRSPWSPRRRHHQSFAQAKTAFVRIVDTCCPPSN